VKPTGKRKREKRGRTTYQPTPAAARAAADVLAPGQLAADYGIKVGTLAGWRATGKGPPFLRLGDGDRAMIRYQRGAFEAWLASREVRPEAPS
jgi:hypothetical protein